MFAILELCKLLAWKAYFLTVTLVFELYNYFIHRECVSRPADPLLLLSAKQLTQNLRAKKVTSVQIVQAYIERINEVNGLINAVVNKNFEEALAKAQKCDDAMENVDANSAEMDAVTVKDSIEYAGLNVTSGLPARRNFICTETATVLQKVCGSGAILLALTNVPEMCMAMETWNSIYGFSRNPYDSRRTPGGSSGGEGALLASAGSVIGIGSDMGGSIRIPALYNGVFGLKTTQGLINTDRHVPIGLLAGGLRKELFVFGPLCRYACDLPLMLRAMSPDAYTKLKVDEPMELEGLRIYYSTLIDGSEKETVDWEIKKRLFDVVRFLESDVGTRAERVHFPEFENAFVLVLAAMHADELPPLAQWITAGTGKINVAAELLKVAFGNSEHSLGLLLGILVEKYPPFDGHGREKLREQLRVLRSKVHDLLANNAILVFPGFNTPAQFHNRSLFTLFNSVYTGVWNGMGTPVVAVPLGLNRNGVPVGCQVIGAPNSERLLVSVAQTLEKKFGGWIPPGCN